MIIFAKNINFMKKYLLLILLFVNLCVNSQSISGTFVQLANQEINLYGFSGFNTNLISTSVADSLGNFKLNYSKSKDYGMGYISSLDNSPLILVLSGEDIVLKGDLLSNKETIQYIRGEENILFEQYVIESSKREYALSGWVYLNKLYKNDIFFNNSPNVKLSIQSEINRLKEEELRFINNLPNSSYIKWYIPIRKLVSSVSTIAQYRPEEIPSSLEYFRKIDYTDSKLYIPCFARLITSVFMSVARIFVLL